MSDNSRTVPIRVRAVSTGQAVTISCSSVLGRWNEVITIACADTKEVEIVVNELIEQHYGSTAKLVVTSESGSALHFEGVIADQR